MIKNFEVFLSNAYIFSSNINDFISELEYKLYYYYCVSFLLFCFKNYYCWNSAEKSGTNLNSYVSVKQRKSWAELIEKKKLANRS